ncbi:hypothetical protein [Pantoea coffeiphila]|uniref:hypothetical protein n=1 Tax=Pantoea coffeiphila TaxID=1465635 RepID=UPI00195FDCE4|nr:hypothetical protein [Pantoea coffeiphila]MBM7345052.1 hypothetical protein [Pantoea coffeiphila]
MAETALQTAYLIFYIISKFCHKRLKVDSLSEKTWYHGSDTRFESWQFPPPVKKGSELLVPHSAVFLTSDQDYAARAGAHLCQSLLNKPENILDTVSDYHNSEMLRLEVMKNSLMARSMNVNQQFWHTGWATGDVLRFTFSDPALAEHIEKMTRIQASRFSITMNASQIIMGLNLTRGLIEVMVKATRSLGYDGFTGYEVDRHSAVNQKHAREIIAIMKPDLISEPDWIR